MQYLFALPLLLSCLPALAEPEEMASNRYGTWRRADPGQFVPINSPVYTSASEASLKPDADIIGIVHDGKAWAFPVRLMTYHHVVNDSLGGRPVAITYCIMANTAVVYDREPGVYLEAGGLFGGVLAMRQVGTSECWAQIARVPLPEDVPTTRTLSIAMPSYISRWDRWLSAHPNTLVLAPVRGFDLRYEAYDRRNKDFVPNPLMSTSITHIDDRLTPGVEVFGLARGDDSFAIPLVQLREKAIVEVQIDNQPVRIVWDQSLETARVEGAFDGFALRSFWYAWAQFYPETRLP